MLNHKTCVCIASGQSLTQEDVDYCRGKATVYVCNDNYKLASWADLLYAADHQWWKYHKDAREFKGEKLTVSYEAEAELGIRRIDYKPNCAWSVTPEYIATGGNSGFQIMNIATLRGFDKLILLGYDMKGKHWFGDHPPSIRTGSRYDNWIKAFEKASPLIPAKVINCSRDTALSCFQRDNLRSVL